MNFYRKKAKKGFTLVELVVVIAVIAVLAAVSVGAYFGITDSANKSAALQHVKQMNDMLVLTHVEDGRENYTFHEARRDVQEKGLDVTTLKEFSSYKYGWDYRTDKFIIVDLNSKTEDGKYSCVAPSEYTIENPKEIFLIARDMDTIANGDFSYYLHDDFEIQEDTIITTKAGIDTGIHNVSSIKLNNEPSTLSVKSLSNSDTASNIKNRLIINTNYYDTSIEVNNKEAFDVYHYGYSHDVIISDTSTGYSYYENGIVGNLKIESGSLQLNSGSKVFVVESSSSAFIDIDKATHKPLINPEHFECNAGHVLTESIVFPDLKNVYRVCKLCGQTMNYKTAATTTTQPEPMGYMDYYLDGSDYNYHCDHILDDAQGLPDESNDPRNPVQCISCNFMFYTEEEAHNYSTVVVEEDGEFVTKYVCNCGCSDEDRDLTIPRANVRQLSVDEINTHLYENNEYVTVAFPESLDFNELTAADYYLEKSNVICGYEFTSVDTHNDNPADVNENSISYSKYKDWYADFIISFDKVVPTDSLAIWGQFDFYNRPLAFAPPFELYAGQMIPLLTTVMMGIGTFIPMTYESIASNVETFRCGAMNFSDTHLYDSENNSNPTKITVELVIYNLDQMTTKYSSLVPDLDKGDLDFTPLLSDSTLRADKEVFNVVRSFDYQFVNKTTLYTDSSLEEIYDPDESAL